MVICIILQSAWWKSPLNIPVFGSSGPVFKKSAMPSMLCLLPFIFQFPPTKNFLFVMIISLLQVQFAKLSRMTFLNLNSLDLVYPFNWIKYRTYDRLQTFRNDISLNASKKWIRFKMENTIGIIIIGRFIFFFPFVVLLIYFHLIFADNGYVCDFYIIKFPLLLVTLA